MGTLKRHPSLVSSVLGALTPTGGHGVSASPRQAVPWMWCHLLTHWGLFLQEQGFPWVSIPALSLTLFSLRSESTG